MPDGCLDCFASLLFFSISFTSHIKRSRNESRDPAFSILQSPVFKVFFVKCLNSLQILHKDWIFWLFKISVSTSTYWDPNETNRKENVRGTALTVFLLVQVWSMSSSNMINTVSKRQWPDIVWDILFSWSNFFQKYVQNYVSKVSLSIAISVGCN